jgi:hypothetical protein
MGMFYRHWTALCMFFKTLVLLIKGLLSFKLSLQLMATNDCINSTQVLALIILTMDVLPPKCPAVLLYKLLSYLTDNL